MTLRVLYICHTAAAGGCARSLSYLLSNFPPGLIRATIVCPPGSAVAVFRKLGAEVVVLPGLSVFFSINGVALRGFRLLTLLRTLWYAQYGRKLRRVIARVRPQLVHINERGMYHAAGIAHRAGLPVLMHARSVADRESGWIKGLSDLLIRRYVDRIAAIDDSVRWSIRESGPCEVLYNPMAVPATGARPELAPGQPIRLGFLAGLLPYKGIWDLLGAARQLRGRRDIVFDVYGGNSRPPDFHRSLLGRLCGALGLTHDIEADIRRFVAEHRLEETVRIHGHVEVNEALFRDMDVLIFPSHLNGVGRSVFEAGMHGIPSIVALADPREDIVVNGVTGFIVPERDPAALAATILRLADDAPLCARLGAAASERYRRQFDARAIARCALGIYARTLATSRAGR